MLQQRSRTDLPLLGRMKCGHMVRATDCLDFIELRQLDGLNDSVTFIIRGRC